MLITRLSYPMSVIMDTLVKCTFNQPPCRDATIFLNQTFFQRATVYAYTELAPDALLQQSTTAFILSLLPMFPWINSYFICTVFHRRNGKAVIKMNVRHQRNVNLFFYSSKDFAASMSEWHSG